MLAQVHRIPFSMEDVYAGFGQVEGILTVNQDRMEFELLTKDAFFGVVKSKPKLIRIPLTEIDSIRYKRNVFISRMYVHVSRLSLVQEFPKSDEGTLVLKIRRNQKENARAIVSFVSYRISELRLSAMDNDLSSDEDR